MKKILIVITYKNLYRMLLFLAVVTILVSAFYIVNSFYLNEMPASDKLGEDEIVSLKKENVKLEVILKSIAPENTQIIYEDQYRNSYLNAKGYTPPTFETFPVQDILKNGKDVKFEVLSDYPSYLRPIYNPSWKDAYYRGWLDLPNKNIEARHKLFIYPFGASSIYDFIGSLGIKDGTAGDYHRNIIFLIYGFNIESIKWYENQAVLVGNPLRTGFQVVSVVQDDLLSEGINTKDMLFQLCTPQGYEIDFIYGNVIEYEYLKKQIEENTVMHASVDVSGYKTLEQLLNANLSLKKELAYFIPLEDKVITQEKCRPFPQNFPLDAPDIQTIRKKAVAIPFKVDYQNIEYNRPVYDPQWLKNYKKCWCYIPMQVCCNQHRLFLIPENHEEQVDFYGILSFHESYKPVNANEYSFLVYNTNINEAVIYHNQVLLIGTPSRTGAEIITVNRSSIPENQNYHVRLVTPDNQETNYIMLCHH